ncbi:cold shock domain-containing protein [Clostridium sardiniense]|uniref:Cold shock domain-containing protein n=1 Tax=Clostridium sardiniense TaxID=29369 RepID=A0ABS7KUF6_CLOSR|nr:cold shock domain-containing protein [Clostridium sardiniense]MBM7835234.1 CspA family cold shock protein [Clostridium sardiniense]MBY0754354.1 cold shock domain-containing protein [Clostridium sardiniense]MDQ0461086.1 CspA family cold shock protein [Clostridium sardiniense]
MASTTGIVKWFNQEKGYGFISCDDGNDVFIHYSNVKEEGNNKDLHEGESVSFDITEGQKGPMAINVQKI